VKTSQASRNNVRSVAVGAIAAMGVATALSLLVTRAAHADTNTNYAWSIGDFEFTKDVSLSKCKNEAVEAFSSSGFSNIDVGDFAVFGKRGRYDASGICLTKKRVAIIAVVGPEKNIARRYDDAIS